MRAQRTSFSAPAPGVTAARLRQKANAMETWAYCGPCERWWYCPESVIEDLAQTTCPVCFSAPARFEERPRLELPAISVD